MIDSLQFVIVCLCSLVAGAIVLLGLNIRANRKLQRTNQALLKEQHLFEIFLEHTPHFVYFKDLSSRFLRISKSYAMLFGLNDASEAIGKTDSDFFTNEHAFEALVDEHRIIATGIPIIGKEEKETWPDGVETWASTHKIPFLDSSGRVLGTFGVSSDITSQKRAESALVAAHKTLELLFDSVATILIVLDAKGAIVRWNSMAIETFCLSRAEVEGKELSQCGIKWLGGPLADDYWLRDEFMDQRRELLFEQNGEKRSLSFTIRKVNYLEDGGLAGFLINAFDTTSHRILELQLRQAQKLESIGQLAAGIAHEINTPMQYVGDNAQFLQDAFRDLEGVVRQYDRLLMASKTGDFTLEKLRALTAQDAKVDSEFLLMEIPKAIEQTIEGVRRVSTLVSAMKEFSHPSSKAKVMIDLNRAIDSTITVARNEWKYVADLETEYDPFLPLVPCVPDEFNQVILNLIVNAAHAISDVVGVGGNEKGKITVRTRRLGNFAEVQIEDTGSGIPINIQDRIFDPFFTTKEVGKGTGQGLAIAHSAIVKRHGGSIRFTTEAGKGTTFLVQIPIEIVEASTDEIAA